LNLYNSLLKWNAPAAGRGVFLCSVLSAEREKEPANLSILVNINREPVSKLVQDSSRVVSVGFYIFFKVYKAQPPEIDQREIHVHEVPEPPETASKASNETI